MPNESLSEFDDLLDRLSVLYYAVQTSLAVGAGEQLAALVGLEDADPSDGAS